MIDLSRLEKLMPPCPVDAQQRRVWECLFAQFANVDITPLSIDARNEPNAPGGSVALVALYADGIERFATYEARQP